MTTVSVLEPSQAWPTSWAQARRPWLNLYGLRLRPGKKDEPVRVQYFHRLLLHLLVPYTAFKLFVLPNASERAIASPCSSHIHMLSIKGYQVEGPSMYAWTLQRFELALIQKLLPEELMLRVFELLPPYMLGKVGCVCQQWRGWSMLSHLWKAACLEAFASEDPTDLDTARQKLYRGSWRDLYLQRPHLRYDGLYVSRNTYIRTGVTEWRTKNPVHLVTYFRYLSFIPDGTFTMRTSPEVVSKVAKSLKKLPKNVKADDPVQVGCWKLKKSWLRADIRLPNKARTEIRSCLHLRSTVLGSNNRLDVDKIVSYDRGNSVVSMIEDGDEDDVTVPGAESYKRGTSTYVFIPDDEIHTHILNQTDLTKMDFFLPG